MNSGPNIEMIETKLLSFDPDNPRLPTSVDGGNEASVINWMLENENVIELMASLAEKGFFPAEPLLVSPSKKMDGRYIVIEGNRRLTAIKLLLNPALATSRKNAIQELVSEGRDLQNLQQVPVIIFSDSEEVQAYLGYRHITGVQPWDSLAKARYLKKLKQSINEPDINTLYRRLAKIIGSRADHVKLLLTGLDVYHSIEEKGFFSIKDLNEKSIKFGVLYTAINNDEIAQYIGVDFDKDEPASALNENQLKDLTTWMFSQNSEGFTRLGESRNLRLLNKVVSNPRALEAFKSGKTLRDAVLLTDEPLKIFQESITEAFSKLSTARDYIHLIDNPTSNDEEMLVEITKLSRSLSNTLRAKRLELEDDID